MLKGAFVFYLTFFMAFIQCKQPTIIVIFGATGDLSQRKLLPALFDLYLKDALPECFRVVGFSRRDISDDAFRTFAHEAITAKEQEFQSEKLENF